MRTSIRSAAAAAIILSVALTACGRRPASPSGFSPPCRLLADASAPADTVTVALPGKIRPDPVPPGRTESERLLFRHLYETLITVDCLGEARPALAASWQPDDDGRTWRIGLRAGARFTDGKPVTAREVLRAWRSGSSTAMSEAGIESVAVVDPYTLLLRFDRPRDGVPRCLADPSLVVWRRDEGSGRPIGTGPYRLETAPRDTGRAVVIRPAPGFAGPVIRFVRARGTDPRDLLGGDVDLLITGEPAVIDYAASREGVETIPLPWDRLYVLLSTTRVRALQRGGRVGPMPPRLAERLASDAVRVEAQVPRFRDGWHGLRDCPDLSGFIEGYPPFPAGSLPGPRRVVYPAGDRVARALAERIVALGRRRPGAGAGAGPLASALPGLAFAGNGLSAAGLDRQAFEERLRVGDDFAYIVAIPARPIDPCLEIRRLLGRARWLALEGVDLRDALLPLVETRRRVLALRGGIGAVIDGRGDLRITGSRGGRE